MAPPPTRPLDHHDTALTRDRARGGSRRSPSRRRRETAPERSNGWGREQPLNGLTDGWAAMLNALERVRARAGAGLDEQDREEVDRLISDLQRIVYR